MAHSEHVVSDSKFKWTEKLVKDLLSALSYSKTIIEFQNNFFNTDKSWQYEKVQEERVKINELFTILRLCLVTVPSDLDSETDDEKLRRDAVVTWKKFEKKGYSCVMVTVSNVRSALFRMTELGICIGSG